MYRAITDIRAFSIRNKKWNNILCKEFDYFTECMKINFMYNFNQHIRKPLIKKKNTDIGRFLSRNDYDQVNVLHNDENEDY